MQVVVIRKKVAIDGNNSTLNKSGIDFRRLWPELADKEKQCMGSKKSGQNAEPRTKKGGEKTSNTTLAGCDTKRLKISPHGNTDSPPLVADLS